MKKDIHTEHCCSLHGCKYGEDAHCSVVSGSKPQSFPCEHCVGYNPNDPDNVQRGIDQEFIQIQIELSRL